jgi:hypothetical protein
MATLMNLILRPRFPTSRVEFVVDAQQVRDVFMEIMEK